MACVEINFYEIHLKPDKSVQMHHKFLLSFLAPVKTIFPETNISKTIFGFTIL